MILLCGAPYLLHLAVGQKNAFDGRRPPDLPHLVDFLDTKLPHVLIMLYRSHKSYHFCDSGLNKILHMEMVVYNCEDSIPGAGVFKNDISSFLVFSYSCVLVIS